MATLSIDIPDELYDELISAAEQRELPLQEFLYIAITEEIDREANRQEFERRYEEFQRTGVCYTIEEVKQHFQQKADAESK